MPNHVENIITLIGDEQKINEVLKAIQYDELGLGTIDFNKIIPMPESLDIESGSRTNDGFKAYREFVEKNALGESEEAFLKRRTDIKADEWELGKTAWNNIQKYGFPTWYEWCTNHWGTKWNAYGYAKGTDYSASGNLYFQTAWSAPHPVIQKLAQMYPEISFVHEWADEDIGYNCGRLTYLNGKCTEEYYPETEEEAVEFACSVWDYDLSDYLIDEE